MKAKDFLQAVEPGIFKVWHFANHPGPFKKGFKVTCTVCNKTFIGTMEEEEYDAYMNSCNERGGPV